MSNLLDLYQEQLKEKEQKESISPVAENNNPIEETQNQSLPAETNFGTDPQEKEQAINTAFSNKTMGTSSTENMRNRYDDPDTWSPEYTDKSFIEEAGNSIMRGIGNHLIKGTGDMLQVVGGLFNENLVKGTFISEALQNAGEDFTANFKQFMPEELQNENLTWASMMKPKFWSTHVAEMIPQLAEFIFLSKGGSSLAKGVAKNMKHLPGTAKTALGEVIPMSGKGLVGKLATDIGLTSTGKMVAGTVGGGLAGNMFSGLLNAAEVINSNKDLKDAEGNLVFSDDDLQQMAAGTIKNNAMWLPMDMASWGLTFAGGWKGLNKSIKSLNPVSKGGKLWTTAQQSKIASNMFAYDVAPIVKGISRLAKKAGAEGFEEMYQESWEEWSKKKAVAAVTGEPMEYNDDFFEFFKSKENEATKVLSFAVGALGAGAFNIKTLINQKADDAQRMFDAQTNLSEIINKQGTDQELEWQQYHIRKTLSNIVIDDKTDATAYEEFAQNLVDNGNITEEEKKSYDEMFQSFNEVKAKGERLNVKGLQALLHNNAIENYAASKLTDFENIAKQNIEDIQSDDMMSENEKAKRIADIETGFMQQVKATSLLIAEAKQNQSNLILGKKASALDLDIQTDQYGNSIVTGGLSTKQFNEYTKEGEANPVSMIELKKSQLKEGGLNVYNKIVEQASSLLSKGKEIVKDKLGKNNETTNEIDASEEIANKENQEAETIDTNITEEEYADFVDNGNVSEDRLNQIAQKVKNQQELDEKETAIFTDKTDAINEILKKESEQIVPTEDYEEFKKSGFVSDEVLDKIADAVNSEQKLDERQDEIHQAYKDDILDRIIKKTLGTKPKKNRKPSVIDNLSKKDTDAISKEFDVEIERTDEGYDVKTKYKGIVAQNHIAKVNEAINAKSEENLSIKDDGDLSKEENEFLKDEANNKAPESQSIEDAQNTKNKQAKDSFKIDQNKVKDAAKKIGLDKREVSKNIRKWNIENSMIGKSFLSRLKKFKTNPDSEHVSQNEIDNYLNQYTTYNLVGPSNLDKMAVVNHNLKRMFPNTNNPTQVIIVRNLFDAIGSQGLGSTLAGTIYIDEKSWRQDNVFMHEMAHIYYQLTQDEPHVQKMVQAMLLDKEYLAEVKSKYDDYTLYNVNLPGLPTQMTKGQIFGMFGNMGVDRNSYEDFLKQGVEDGSISTIPLRQQKYIIEEMFVGKLEGPLSNNFDKVFNNKTEVQRQADVKKWWGLIRKKGEIIENDGGVDKMLRQLYDSNDVPNGDLKGFIFDTFKAVTKGVTFDSYGLDSRADGHTQEYIDEINNIRLRKEQQINNEPENISSLTEEIDRLDSVDFALENDGEMFYDKSFDSKIKATSRILRRFGVVYNKTLRAKKLIQTKDKTINRSKVELFNRDLFESVFYNLATENNSADEFIYNIENSSLKEVQAFNRYLDKVYPNTKLQLLNSMHYVLSNSKHIAGFRNTINDKGEHNFTNSLSVKEINSSDNVLESIRYSFNEKDSGNSRWNNYQDAVRRIHDGKTMSNEDFHTVIEMISPINFNLDKVLEQGYVTYKGVNVPIETLIAGFIKKGYLFNPGSKNVYYAAARPLVEALIVTNRKFTPLSSVKNAEGNMEPVRITNNHLTKEIDNIVNFLAPNAKGVKPTLDEFLDRFSHLSHRKQDELGKSYVPNQFLENIYEQYQNGIMPTISQYHGLEDISNNKGSLYKNSTALEQNIEDILTFVESSTKPSGARNNYYLGNMGAFSDSPRKFFMNMKRISYDDVFIKRNGKTQFNPDGKIINSIFSMHNEMFDDETTGNKAKFRNSFRQAVSDSVSFINENAEALSKVGKLKKYITEDKKTGIKSLNNEGQKMIAEYTINSIVNGYNVAEVFAPNIKGKDIVKRFKMNSSPIMSVKNPNFKIEPIFFADEIVNNSISGTDSGMYILKEDAEMFQRLGKGVFEMNSGFKFLNASIEKDNPNFKGSTAYLKGYTTIVDETHPLYKIMRARKDKYLAYHEKTFGTKPSMDLSDGTFNHVVIAVPQSSDKSNFSPDKFTSTNENGNLEYTEKGQKFTEQALSENIDEAMKYYDDLYYDKKGNFLGISGYNFGPQQLMDKTTKRANTPVQMINSIIVNATLNGKLNEAYEIQRLLSAQKRANLQKTLDEIKTANIEEYKKLIMKSLNTEDMNQAQRILLQDGGSLAHPYVNEIVVNQLAKTIRRDGNKLSTTGTYAHQKSDSGWRTQSKGNKALKGYQTNGDGSLSAAEIVLPKHMETEGNVKPRTILTTESDWGKQAIRQGQSNWSKKEIEELGNDYTQTMNLLQFAALDLAKLRHNVNTKQAEKYIVKEYNSEGVHIGFHVKGDTVIASRVPGHGPSSTGVFEVVGFDNGDGNQTMVSSEFNDIIGSDNDGDALFIQTKSNKKGQENWNQAFDKIKDYWLSPEMAEQITAKIDFEEDTKAIIKKVNEKYPSNKEYVMPFSPKQRMNDYNNTMVSKRSVGPVFNTHKITNMLAAVEAPITQSIKIGKNIYDKFYDNTRGNSSRNQQSAILANIILDNSKHQFADSLGLNEHNISQAVILVNMGVPLEEIGMILNSPAAKLWSEFNRTNNSMFHENKNKDAIKKAIYKELKLKETKSNSLKISMDNVNKNGQHQASIVELMSYLSDMNSDIQKISTIMGGHNKIHVNPLVLEQQIKEFIDVINNKSESKTIEFNDAFKANPDMQNYLEVAEETLKHLRNINPIYQNATNSVLESLTQKIGEDLSAFQIEKISQDLLKFNTARLLGLNNKPKEYVENLLDKSPGNKESIYNKLEQHISYLKKQIVPDAKDPNNPNKAYSLLENSVLFTQAMSFNLYGNTKYISAKSSFVNDSFNEIERQQAQDEFEQLPVELQNDLILYDMIERGWKGPLSLSPFFGSDINLAINMASNEAMKNKNAEISPKILKELERVVALKSIKESNNPFNKVYVNTSIKTNEAIVDEIFKNKKIFNKIINGTPMYVNVVRVDKNQNRIGSLLFELEPFTDEEIQQVVTERSWSQKKQRTESIARNKMKHVPDTLSKKSNNIDLTIIPDQNVMQPFSAFEGSQKSKSLDYLVEASISYEEAMKKLRESAQTKSQSLDAREDFYDETFTKKQPLSYAEYQMAMEFKPYMSDSIKRGMYDTYLVEKDKANKLVEKGVLNNLESKSTEELNKMYNTYGERDVYAFSGIITPVVKQLAKVLIHEQSELFKKNNVTAVGNEGQDVSAMKSYLMSGSTIPSNHPASQSLARMLEKEYKNFINEKKVYMQEMNRLSDNLYREQLGYGGKKGLSIDGIRNVAMRIKDALFSNREDIYNRLYGNLVVREEYLNDKNTLVFNYKLKPVKEVEELFARGEIGKAQKEFYDFFRKTTNELMPSTVKEVKEDYIPHTSMSKLEMFSSRGLLGLLANSRSSDQAIYDVKLNFKGELMNFKQIEDLFKYDSAKGFKNDINKSLEYRKLKIKANKLLEKGVNEDGSKILLDAPFVETALGFGAINRFANNRSVKATELPSMDLNKALGDYIHSSLFVNGNKGFKGMLNLQGHIEGVLAWNAENNLPNMNNHIQKIWKDYFLKNKRQTSVLGETADRVILGLTRLNLFYALGYKANVNTGGLYALGNVLAGKYHNIKDLGGKAWLKGEMRFWGMDKGFKGGIKGVMDRMKRNAQIMKELNFMEINVYDEVTMEKKHGLDAVFTDLALAPMIYSEKWIQQVHMLGMLTDEQLDKFDENGKYKDGAIRIDNEDLIRLEDQVKSSHGRGYQPTDQRGIQMYSWGNMMLQFSRFIPTMVHDRFAKEDVNIYGRENIGTMRAVGKMLRYVMNDPKGFVEYRNSLSEEQRKKLDSGLRGMAMSTIIGFAGQINETADGLFNDINYYWNYPKLSNKLIPATIQSTNNMINGFF